jgi:MYXO-CTERM domain-containing protein
MQMCIWLAVCGASVTLTSPVAANGRFPRGQRLLEDPADSSHLVLSATYGILTSADRGQSWYFICETSFAELGAEADPMVALTPDGGLVASLYSNLSVAGPDACDFTPTLADGRYLAVPDFAAAPDRPEQLLAAVVATPTGEPPTHQLHVSSDSGQSWNELVAALPNDLKLLATVDVAPSDPDRIYVSGLGPDDEGVLLRSDDAGQTFEVLALPTDASNVETPYIAAVYPQDADAIYVRTDAWIFDPSDGISWASDALLYSDDGGETFQELLRAPGKLLGFALAPDGSEVLAGYGDPVEGGGRLVDGQSLGIYRAPAGSSAFEKVFASSVSCLTWTGEGVYVCGSQAELGFALGLTQPAELDAADFPNFEPLLSLPDVSGPLDCPECTSGARCAQEWYGVCLGWGRDDCEPPGQPPDESLCPTTGGAGGEASTPVGAGSPSQLPAGAAGAEPSEGGQGNDTPSPTGDDSGCGCRAVGSAPSSWVVGLLGVGLVAWWRRRSRGYSP